MRHTMGASDMKIKMVRRADGVNRSGDMDNGSGNEDSESRLSVPASLVIWIAGSVAGWFVVYLFISLLRQQ